VSNSDDLQKLRDSSSGGRVAREIEVGSVQCKFVEEKQLIGGEDYCMQTRNFDSIERGRGAFNVTRPFASPKMGMSACV